jgi:Tol biopolymer transport system component
MNADGSNVERLTYAGGWVPAWSPDGSSIAFAGRAGNQGEVFVMNADGTGAVNLTNDPAPDWWPAWSPDGTKIVFSSGRRTPVPGDPPYDLYVMNADGSGLVRITTSNTLDWYADWRP